MNVGKKLQEQKRLKVPHHQRSVQKCHITLTLALTKPENLATAFRTEFFLLFFFSFFFKLNLIVF